MGGGKDQSDANNMLRTQQGNVSAFNARNEGDLNASRAKADDLYGSIRGGYGTMSTADREKPIAPGAGAAYYGAGTGGGGGGGGAPMSGASLGEAANSYRNFMNNGAGIDPSANAQLNDSEAAYREFMSTGGWDPNRVASMDQNIQGLKEFGRTGGLDATAMNRMRGNGVFDEFSQTGGLSTGDRNNIRARGNSGIPMFFGQMKDEANRQAAVQGGYGPGRAAMMSRMGRGQAGAAADAALNTELGIMDKVNAGRQWGTQGMSTAENALQGLRTNNMYSGMMGASGVEQGLQESIRAGKEYGTSGLASIGENARAAAMQAAQANAQFKLQGTQGIEGMAQADRSAGMAGSSNAFAQNFAMQQALQEQENWAAQFQQQQRQAGLTGLNSLYAGAPGEYMANKDFSLSGVGAGSDVATRLKSGNKSWADYLTPIAGGAAGVASGLGSFGSFKPKPVATAAAGG